MYEMIRHIPYNNHFDIDASKRDFGIGSFFFASVKKISLLGSDNSYEFCQLKTMLNKFNHITHINLSNVPVAPTIAQKLILCMPNKSYHGKLKVLVEDLLDLYTKSLNFFDNHGRERRIQLKQ
jgi:hypothetical protein